MKNLSASKELEYLAKKYVWWESPAWACKHPTVFLANIMNLGTWDDWQLMRRALSDDYLKEVLLESPSGYFSQRFWDYWHCKLGFKNIPPLPKRKFL